MPRKVSWQDDWLSANYLHYESYTALTDAYNERFNESLSLAAVKNHMRLKLGIHKPRENCRHYTDEQIVWLTKNLPKYGRSETCRMFNERFNESRTVRAMKSFTTEYGVKVDESVWKKHVTENVNKNKLKDIGTVRIDHGRKMVKMSDGKWGYQNRVIYEARHGKIPKGYCIVHLDSDPLNCEAENLVCVPRAILSTLIGADLKSEHPSITKTALTWAELCNALKKGQNND